jgi:nucleoprotein TPR
VAENARLKLESEVEQAKVATTHDASETTAMKSRIASLESSNRDTLALLESKTTAYNSLSQELTAQHEKAIELRKQVSGLEQTIQTANSAAASARFREQSLEQDRDLLKKNAEWFENELKTKAAEHFKFRKEKNARVAELNQSTEQYISEAEGLRRSESSLRSRLDEQIQKVEDLMIEIQQLREEKLTEADALRADLDNAKHLATLQEAKANTHQQRADHLAHACEEVKENAAEEVGQLRAEIETEHTDREAAEQRVAELESVVQQLQNEAEIHRSRPGTPSRGMNGPEMSTPLRLETPTGIFSPASGSRMKGTLSMTQMYSEYKRLERELANERQTTDRLQSELDTMLQDLEINRPEIDELRLDHERLRTDLVDMSNTLQNANHERDQALKQVRTLQGQVESHSKEAILLTQQVRDANTQIKVLLLEQDLQAKGQQLSPAEYAELHQAAIGDIAHQSPTSQVISNSLTTFQNIKDLTDQNSKMLRMLRELGEKMEGDEAKARERQYHTQCRELEEANSQLARLRDELKLMVANSHSYTKERDMFQRLLARKGQLQSADNLARSLPLAIGSSQGFDESVQGSTAGGDIDYGKLLRETQMQFDSYRQETLTDQTALKSQLSELSKRNSQLQAEASRAISQLSAANQRSEMLQANFNALKTENAEVQKRSQTFMENATRQELKSQQAAEELIENKGLLDGMRRENANLKAEKDLWRTIERRLLEDTESLRNERSRLDQLNSSLQTMLNEQEQSDSETRRRLQAQVESLDAELQTTKRKLSEEVDEGKKATLRREYDHEQTQKRIDDLVTTLGGLREELSAAMTTRDHLQARVDEITIDLRSAEERVAVLSQPATQTAEEDPSNESSLSREQELAVEVSELKRDLDQKTSELARTVEQVEVYKSIAQQAEDRLQELAETNDQYREETERDLEEKNAKVRDLEQRIEDITSELTTTNTELSKLRDEHSESGRRLDEQKNTLEAEIARVKEEAERNLEQAQYNLEASKAQGQIATEAQQNYEKELILHAEAAKTAQSHKAEVSQLKLDLVDSRTKAESATRDLAQKEESWAEMKGRFERELSDLKQRREEVVQQNTLLHNQLETLTNQISQLQKDRAATVDSEANNESPATGADNLQEVIKYLRREKEIVDVQYHLSTQEQKRLRQQLDFTQTQLDDTRLKLDQQRRTEADTERNAMSHTKLMDTLNELNLYRESSVTLRGENKRLTDALAEKTRRIEELEVQLEPLQTRITELENLSEMCDGEMKLLQDDRDHWRQRTQNILSKYDRVDPAELESLKEKVTGLETERDQVVATRDELQAQVDNLPEQVKTANAELRARLGEQFKTKVKELNGKIKDKQTEVDTANAEKDALQTELGNAKQALEAARSQAPAGQAIVNGVSGSGTESNATTTNKESGTDSNVAQPQARVQELEAALAQKDQEIASLNSQAQVAKDQALQEQKLHLEAEHQQALEDLRSKSVAVSSQFQKSTNTDGAPQTSAAEADANTQSDDLPTLTDAQARALVQKNELVRNILRTNINRRLEKEKEAWRKEFELSQAAIQDTTSPSQVAELEKKVATHEEALKQKEEAFSAQKEALIKEQNKKLDSEKLTFSQEAEKKIADQVALHEKRTAVQLSMATSKARLSQAKIDVVKKAAEETPEKPVGEVWETAKDAKPPPQPKPASAASLNGPPSSPAGSLKTAPALNGPVNATPAPDQPAAQSGTPAIWQPSAQHAAPNGIPKPAQGPPASGPAVLKPLLQTGIPRGGASARGGRGAAAGGQAQNTASSDTQQFQPAARGTGIPRGNYRVTSRGGRAGASNVQTGALPAVRGAIAGSSPRSFNPTAPQFNPQGNKRAREDGEVGDAGNAKKARGGGAGST